MVSKRETSLLLEPEAPMWAQRLAARMDLRFQLAWPHQPIKIWSVTKANLPDPSKWTSALVYVSDVKKLGISDGTTWRDAMGGAI